MTMEAPKRSSWEDILKNAIRRVKLLNEKCRNRNDVFLMKLCSDALSGDMIGSKKGVDEENASSTTTSTSSSRETSDESSCPIVDVVVVGAGKWDASPPAGFEKLDKNRSGSKANLNSGTRGKPLYICTRASRPVRAIEGGGGGEGGGLGKKANTTTVSHITAVTPSPQESREKVGKIKDCHDDVEGATTTPSVQGGRTPPRHRESSAGKFETPVKLDRLSPEDGGVGDSREGHSSNTSLLLKIRRDKNGDLGVKFDEELLVVALNGWARSLGFRLNQQIVACDGIPVYNSKDLIRCIARNADDDATFTIRVNVASSASHLTGPITRIVAVLADKGEFVPPGHICVRKFPGGEVADVNEGAGSGGRVLLCYRRGYGLPVCDVDVLQGRAKFLTNIQAAHRDHRIIWRTLLGTPADLNDFTSAATIFLSLKRDLRMLVKLAARSRRLALVLPLLVALYDNSPTMFVIGCSSLLGLIECGYFDPPGVGSVPSTFEAEESRVFPYYLGDASNGCGGVVDLSVAEEGERGLALIDFVVMNVLCESFPPTIEPGCDHKTLLTVHAVFDEIIRRAETLQLKPIALARIIWCQCESIEFLVREEEACKAMEKSGDNLEVEVEGKSLYERQTKIGALIEQMAKRMKSAVMTLMTRFEKSRATNVRETSSSSTTKTSKQKDDDDDDDNDDHDDQGRARDLELLLRSFLATGAIFAQSAVSSVEICDAVEKYAPRDESLQRVLVAVVILSRVALTFPEDVEDESRAPSRTSFSSPPRNSPIHKGKKEMSLFERVGLDSKASREPTRATENPSVASVRCRVRAIECLTAMLARPSKALLTCEQTLFVIRRFVGTAAMRNFSSVTIDAAPVFKANLVLVQCLWSNYRHHLKVEFAEFWGHGLRPLLRTTSKAIDSLGGLRLSPSDHLIQLRLLIVELLTKWFEMPQHMLDLFLNFDNDTKLVHSTLFADLAQEMMHIAAPSWLDDSTHAVSTSGGRSRLLHVAGDALKIMARSICNMSGTVLLQRAKGAVVTASGATSDDSAPSTPESSSTAPSRLKNQSSVLQRHHLRQERQKVVEAALALGEKTENLRKTVKYLIAHNALMNTSRAVSDFIQKYHSSLEPTWVGNYLSERGADEEEIEFMNDLRKTYIQGLELGNLRFVAALRRFLCLGGFMLPKEAQKIDRLLEAFANVYFEANASQTALSCADTAYFLAFSTLLLNTSVSNPHCKNVMSLEQWTASNAKCDPPPQPHGSDLPEEMLVEIYDDITTSPLRIPGQQSPPGLETPGDKRSVSARRESLKRLVEVRAQM
eukprot:g5164.t1